MLDAKEANVHTQLFAFGVVERSEGINVSIGVQIPLLEEHLSGAIPLSQTK